MTSLARKRCAIYARFSSAQQRDTSIDDQVARCKEFAVRHGGIVESELVFADYAVSGASLQRPGFEGLMRAVESGKAEAIVTEDMSRISRDFSDAAYIFKKLQFAGIPLLGVGDGIDTSRRDGKMTFTLKSLMSDMFLDDLRDKTLRGLEGRALAGMSTGGLPFGYRSVRNELSGQIGSRVEVDTVQADIVRQIFNLYSEGTSYAGIARVLNETNVAPPRANTRHRRKGWVASTIRGMLSNEAYVGVTTFKKKQWIKAPGTNKRRYRKRDASEVIRREDPERRIVPQDLWNVVRARASAVDAKYKGKGDRRAPGNRTRFPLSGLLLCSQCNAAMVVSGGSSASYYRCGDNKKRGTCSNALSVREDVARTRIFGAIHDELFTPTAIDHLRRKIAALLGEFSRTMNRELSEHRGLLDRTEQRIRGLVAFIADGDRSEYVVTTLRDLEAQARTEKAAITDLIARAKSPARLPTPEEVLTRATDLEATLAGDPVRAREALRRIFKDGRIVLHPQPDGFYTAEASFFPLVALTPETTNPPAGAGGSSSGTAVSCAGRI